ncbi:MAG: NlpD-related protein family M37 unassigned peptidase (NlpD protein) [Zetaproteobacteria bacterium]|nr:MAG: NlpD-related protein family M37 unassigned peptidase (NlpD protein) [Zetaproteobacteria bacterium]
MMRLPVIVCCLCAWLGAVATGAWADQTTEQQLQRVHQERQRLARLRARLEARLGGLLRELREQDMHLVQASRAREQAEQAFRAVDRRVRALQQQRKALEREIEELRERLLREAVAAWKRTGQFTPWQMLLGGVAINEIPHRRYLLHYLMRDQQRARARLADDVRRLARLEQELAAQRDSLKQAWREKQAAEQALRRQLAAKRAMIRRIDADVRLKKQRDRELAEQEQALRDLLHGIARGLLQPERQLQGHRPVRALKGRLPWPLRKGRIVAGFGARPAPNRPRLAGVEMAPRGSREVRAIAAGRVRYADWFGGYGLMMIVDHGDGILSVYAHNNALYWQVGDWVEQGERLATAGNTGWSSQVRLYFEVRDRGRPVNPRRWCGR